LPIKEIVDIGVQIAKALAAAHGAGIVHRDIKPENIMVRDDGYVKVVDFGLARTMAEADTSQLTQATMTTTPGLALRTRSYMSPEQAAGRPIGPASDIFAFGIVLYEMAGGRRPFIAASNVEVIASILKEDPVPLARVSPDAPPALGSLVQWMLEKDAARRP